MAVACVNEQLMVRWLLYLSKMFANVLANNCWQTYTVDKSCCVIACMTNKSMVNKSYCVPVGTVWVLSCRSKCVFSMCWYPQQCARHYCCEFAAYSTLGIGKWLPSIFSILSNIPANGRYQRKRCYQFAVLCSKVLAHRYLEVLAGTIPVLTNRC